MLKKVIQFIFDGISDTSFNNNMVINENGATVTSRNTPMERQSSNMDELAKVRYAIKQSARSSIDLGLDVAYNDASANNRMKKPHATSNNKQLEKFIEETKKQAIDSLIKKKSVTQIEEYTRKYCRECEERGNICRGFEILKSEDECKQKKEEARVLRKSW